MKKILALPLFAMAVLVSSAWADCNVGTNGTTSCCRWDNNPENCWGIGGTYDEMKTASDCTGNYGEVVTDCSASLKVVLGCCNWETEGALCWTIYAGPDPIDGSDGATKVAACSGGSNRYWDAIACPTTTEGACPATSPTYDGKNPSEGFCCFEGNSYNDYEGYCGPISATLTLESCLADFGVQMQDCSGCNTTPNLKTPAPSTVIDVAPFGRSLHIFAAKEATVSLYDMSGVKVYSGRVPGNANSVLSLEKVSSGSYYAIIQSGSYSKKIPVILK